MLMQTMLVLNNKTTRKRGEESESYSTSNETQKVRKSKAIILYAWNHNLIAKANKTFDY